MNVVLLSSARRTSPEAALSVREQLGLAGRGDVVLRLVTRHRPSAPLPGIETLVLVPTATSPGRVLDIPAADLPGEAGGAAAATELADPPRVGGPVAGGGQHPPPPPPPPPPP
nr:hypothetical protein [Phycicoccus sp.]